MNFEPIRISNKTVNLHKACQGAIFDVPTVLTVDPFSYVDLWLRRKHKDESLFYWRQAKDFYKASQGLSLESSPLILYYCFMNAAKALLSSKGVDFRPIHGVAYYSVREGNIKAVLSNEGIKFKQSGIVPALTRYFGENESQHRHSLEEVLYNLVFVHRTYRLSYSNKKERFMPLRSARFVRDEASGEVFLSAQAVEDADWNFFKKRLPYQVQAASDGSATVVSRDKVSWANQNSATSSELEGLSELNKDLRKCIHYINGAQTLWYLKSDGDYKIDRQSITLTLAAMHRLSEVCRYKPSDLRSFLSGQRNWLLSEFVSMSSQQFLDEIACEMTGHQIMIPNVRAPI